MEDYDITQKSSRDHANTSKLDKYDTYTQKRNDFSSKVKIFYTAEDSYSNSAGETCLSDRPDDWL